MMESTKRFSDRVENYVKYRPSYPQELVTFIREKLNLSDSSTVADVGSGTGISSELFLKLGAKVYGIEPNKEMREAAENILNKYQRFHSLDGASTETGVVDHSVDYVVAAQAFHWFDPEPTKIEFKRILKNNGFVLLIWNDRKTEGSAFSQEYEGIVSKYGTDYKQVNHKNIDDMRIKSFLGDFKKECFYNYQEFDFEGLLGRLTSSSYTPNKDHPNYKDMVKALNVLFDKYQRNGLIKIEYETQLFYSNWQGA